MADIRSAQVIAQVEWQDPPLIKASQVIAQVEYAPTPFGEYNGNITLGLIPVAEESAHYVYGGDITTSLSPESEYGSGNFYYGDVAVSLIPESEALIAFIYTGDIPVALIPEADIIGDYGYEGIIPLELYPEGFSVIPKPGFDWWYGYGLVDLTFLSGNPPYYCATGDIGATFSFDSTVLPYRRHTVVGSGGARIGGAGVVAFEDPASFTVVGSGGLKIDGEGDPVFSVPPVYTIIAEGGAKLSGAGTIVFVGESELPVHTIIGSGGLTFSGAGSVSFIKVKVPYVVIGDGGLSLSGKGVVSFVDVADLTYSVIGSGGLALAGASITAFIDVTKLYTVTGSGGLILSGAGRISIFAPAIFKITGSGGLVVSGDGLADKFVYQTWVLTGTKRHASIYSGQNFNSYCKYNGNYYAAGEDEIVQLVGTKDGVNTIHPGIKIGPTNFDTFNRKRIRKIYTGTPNGSARVRVSGTTGDTTKAKDFLATNGRADITRDIVGEELSIEVSDFDELTMLEIRPVVLGKKRHG